jgi:hypothetical protein
VADPLLDRDCALLDGACKCPRGTCKRYDRPPFRVGDRVGLSDQGKRLMGTPRAERRKAGIVLNKARFKDCWRIEWASLSTPEVVHRTNLQSFESPDCRGPPCPCRS